MTENEAKVIIEYFYHLNSRKESLQKQIIPIEKEMNGLIEDVQRCLDHGYGYLIDEHVNKRA